MTVETSSCLVSVGMPVRNESRFLREALDALVGQVGVKFEIIISDNASSDDTGAICKEYSAKYPFISYHRYEENVGPSINFQYVLAQAKGQYFMWASGHDLWDRNYLQACSKLLDSQPEVMIAFGTTCWIDGKGEPHGRITGWSDTRGLHLVGRYFTVFWGHMNPIVALIRSDQLKKQKIDDMVGIDLVMLLNLAMQGDFAHALDTSWQRREFRHEVVYQQKLERYRSAEFAWGRSLLGRYFPLARLPLRIVGDLFASPLTVGQKIMLLLILMVSMPVKYLVDRSRKRESSVQATGADTSMKDERQESGT